MKKIHALLTFVVVGALVFGIYKLGVNRGKSFAEADEQFGSTWIYSSVIRGLKENEISVVEGISKLALLKSILRIEQLKERNLLTEKEKENLKQLQNELLALEPEHNLGELAHTDSGDPRSIETMQAELKRLQTRTEKISSNRQASQCEITRRNF